MNSSSPRATLQVIFSFIFTEKIGNKKAAQGGLYSLLPLTTSQAYMNSSNPRATLQEIFLFIFSPKNGNKKAAQGGLYSLFFTDNFTSLSEFKQPARELASEIAADCDQIFRTWEYRA
jgi:hypothetical protein